MKEERLKDAHSFLHSDTIDQPDEDAQKSIDSNKIHEAVGRIPEKWREAFILSKYENLKYSEIARKMAISEKTAGSTHELDDRVDSGLIFDKKIMYIFLVILYALPTFVSCLFYILYNIADNKGELWYLRKNSQPNLLQTRGPLK